MSNQAPDLYKLILSTLLNSEFERPLATFLTEKKNLTVNTELVLGVVQIEGIDDMPEEACKSALVEYLGTMDAEILKQHMSCLKTKRIIESAKRDFKTKEITFVPTTT